MQKKFKMLSIKIHNSQYYVILIFKKAAVCNHFMLKSLWKLLNFCCYFEVSSIEARSIGMHICNLICINRQPA